MSAAETHALWIIYVITFILGMAYLFLTIIAAINNAFRPYTLVLSVVSVVLSLAATIASTQEYSTPAARDTWKAEFNIGTDIVTICGAVPTFAVLIVHCANKLGLGLGGLGLGAAIVGLVSSVASREEHFGTPFSNISQPWIGGLCFGVGTVTWIGLEVVRWLEI